jgi:hypothetical protein
MAGQNEQGDLVSNHLEQRRGENDRILAVAGLFDEGFNGILRIFLLFGSIGHALLDKIKNKTRLLPGVGCFTLPDQPVGQFPDLAADALNDILIRPLAEVKAWPGGIIPVKSLPDHQGDRIAFPFMSP